MAIGKKMIAGESSGTNRRKRKVSASRMIAQTAKTSIPIENECPTIKAPDTIGMNRKGRTEHSRAAISMTNVFAKIPFPSNTDAIQ